MDEKLPHFPTMPEEDLEATAGKTKLNLGFALT